MSAHSSPALLPLNRALLPFWLPPIALDVLASAFLETPTGAILVHAVVFAVVFRLWHQAMHHPWSGKLQALHAIHHDHHYPPGRLTSPRYLSEGGFHQEAALFLVLGVALGLSAALGTSGRTVAVCGVSWGLYLGAGALLHRALHTSPHPLERFRWFRDMRALHDVHHLNQAVNFGIVESAIDAALGTLHRPAAEEPTRSESAAVPEDQG